MCCWPGLIGSNSFSCIILQGGVNAGLRAQHVRLISDVRRFIFPSPRCRRVRVSIQILRLERTDAEAAYRALVGLGNVVSQGIWCHCTRLGAGLTYGVSCTPQESKRFHWKWVRLARSRQLSPCYLPSSKTPRSMILSMRSWGW